MSSYADRLAALREQLKADRLDGFVVPLTDEHMSEYVGSYAQRLAWLTGFEGSAGSAVVLPEVFLKCVTLVRNLGHPLSDITTANFDFIQSYRPLTNVVRRPTEKGAGQGYSITGHHELTIPLLAAMLIRK